MSIFQNTCKPEGLAGRLMLLSMNCGHAAMAKWGNTHLAVAPDDDVLDLGCGGGANVKTLLTLCPEGHVTGLDYSPVSVEKTRAVNKKAIAEGRCEVLQANVMELPFEAESFDQATAYETIYFWPDLQASFREVFRVLRPGGAFMICNETDGLTHKDDKWVKKIDGMRVYTPDELVQTLKAAGFEDVNIVNNKKHWLCATAVKP